MKGAKFATGSVARIPTLWCAFRIRISNNVGDDAGAISAAIEGELRPFGTSPLIATNGTAPSRVSMPGFVRAPAVSSSSALSKVG